MCCTQASVAEIYEVENIHICKYSKMSWPKLSPSTPSPPSTAPTSTIMFTRAITAAARQLSRVPRVQSAVTSKACTWQRACVATAGKQVLARSFASSTAPAMYVRCPPVQLCHCNSYRCCMVCWLHDRRLGAGSFVCKAPESVEVEHGWAEPEEVVHR